MLMMQLWLEHKRRKAPRERGDAYDAALAGAQAPKGTPRGVFFLPNSCVCHFFVVILQRKIGSQQK